MELEYESSEPRRTPQTQDGRGKTSLRLKYEGEVAVIKKKWGDLEEIRERLGLSQRKMAQLLLVDPSAWCRWVRDGNAPPHIYRALHWYLLLLEKEPAWHPQLSTISNLSLSSLEKRLSRLEQAAKSEIESGIKSFIQKKFWVQLLGLGAAITGLIAIVFLSFN